METRVSSVQHLGPVSRAALVQQAHQFLEGAPAATRQAVVANKAGPLCCRPEPWPHAFYSVSISCCTGCSSWRAHDRFDFTMAARQGFLRGGALLLAGAGGFATVTSTALALSDSVPPRWIHDRLPPRQEQLRKLSQGTAASPYDVLIIGGGCAQPGSCRAAAAAAGGGGWGGASLAVTDRGWVATSQAACHCRDAKPRALFSIPAGGATGTGCAVDAATRWGREDAPPQRRQWRCRLPPASLPRGSQCDSQWACRCCCNSPERLSLRLACFPVRCRGLRTAMIEREDFAAGTSSRSTKLVHGGVRYLEKVGACLPACPPALQGLQALAPYSSPPYSCTPIGAGAAATASPSRRRLALLLPPQAFKNLDYGQLKLVFEALHERNVLLQNVPFLSNPLPIMTVSAGLRGTGGWVAWLGGLTQAGQRCGGSARSRFRFPCTDGQLTHGGASLPSSLSPASSCPCPASLCAALLQVVGGSLLLGWPAHV